MVIIKISTLIILCVCTCVATPCTGPADQPNCRKTLPATSETSAQVLHLHCITVEYLVLIQNIFFIMFAFFYIHYRRMLLLWRTNVHLSVEERKKETQAKCHYQHSLLSKVLLVCDCGVGQCLMVWVFKVMALKSINILPFKN